MRINYFYQQMLAFFAVVMTVLIILGFSFLQFARSTAYRNTETQLFGYAEALIDEDLQTDKIESGQIILKNQGVSIFVFDQTDNMTYPVTTEDYVSGISDTDLDKLKNGEPLSLTQRNTDLFGNQVDTAIVYQPFFTQSTGDFYGFIAVSAPISTIESSLEDIRNNLFSAFIFSLIGATIASYFFAKFQVNRINRIRSATHKVAKGDFTIQLENKEMDEFDDLAADFNSMVDSLKSAQEEIERQENRRRQFMADAAHEMRTPLTTINGLLEGIEHDMIPENQKQRSIQLMQNETRRLIRLVNENLDYEKIRSNQIVLQKQLFNAYEALEMIVEQLKGKANDSGNELVLECPTDLMLFADYDRFSQIIVNIIQNAIQFTDNGEISIIGYASENETILKIKDSGIGMSAEEVESIWERYYKADSSRKNTKYGESGLGLAIVQQLVNLHDASVTVESVSGEGTTFTLIFPIEETKKS